MSVCSHRNEVFSDLSLLEEGDEDDDPEYNFVEDVDEPDLEDYRNDRAVRITSGSSLSSLRFRLYTDLRLS